MKHGLAIGAVLYLLVCGGAAVFVDHMACTYDGTACTIAKFLALPAAIGGLWFFTGWLPEHLDQP